MRGGKEANITKVKVQPLVKAKTRPATVIERDIIVVPIFSPRALWMERTSFLSREDSS